MIHSALEDIAEALHPHLIHEDTAMRCNISVFKRVPITVWWLVNVASYRVLGGLFGVGMSTAGETVIEVCLAMELELLSRTVCPGDIREVNHVLCKQ